MEEKLTKLNIIATDTISDNYYIGISGDSSQQELDALVSLLGEELVVEHYGRMLKNVSLPETTSNRKIDYIKRRDLKITYEGYSQELRERLNMMDPEQELVVRLRLDNPVVVEEALELNIENLRKITQEE